MEGSSAMPTKVYSNVESSAGAENKADYWSNAERRGKPWAVGKFRKCFNKTGTVSTLTILQHG